MADTANHPPTLAPPVRSVCRAYAGFVAVFLALQGSTTLAARLWPAFDAAFPALLATTRMVPSHSLLHLATAAVAAAVLRWAGRPAARRLALGFGLFYVGLALAGSASDSALCLGLQRFDHPFHALLGGLGIAAWAVDRWRAAGAAPMPTRLTPERR